MKPTAFIFGAGKTGRGFAAHLAHLGGYEVILIDKDKDLMDRLKNEGKYTIRVLGAPARDQTIIPKRVFHIREDWISEFTDSHLAFVSVFGNNLEALSQSLAKGIAAWLEKNQGYLNIITCENFTHAAQFLKGRVGLYLSSSDVETLNDRVGFSESMVLRTCLAAEDPDSLTVRAQNFFELPCDEEALKGGIPGVPGLRPLNNFSHQLRRKIYTYNGINAVITYLGAEKGYTWLWEAGNDPAILRYAKKAAKETSEAQIREYGFDRKEQGEWVKSAFSKFADTAIPDPIDRNGADPVRKLNRNDRLIGPALLALKHGIEPEGLIRGIIAGFRFYDKNRDYSISADIRSKGLDEVLRDICGLSPDEKLYMLLKKHYS